MKINRLPYSSMTEQNKKWSLRDDKRLARREGLSFLAIVHSAAQHYRLAVHKELLETRRRRVVKTWRRGGSPAAVYIGCRGLGGKKKDELGYVISSTATSWRSLTIFVSVVASPIVCANCQKASQYRKTRQKSDIQQLLQRLPRRLPFIYIYTFNIDTQATTSCCLAAIPPVYSLRVYTSKK